MPAVPIGPVVQTGQSTVCTGCAHPLIGRPHPLWACCSLGGAVEATWCRCSIVGAGVDVRTYVRVCGRLCVCAPCSLTFVLVVCRCVENCTSGDVASAVFVPLVNVTCVPGPPPTVGTGAPTPSLAPTMQPTWRPTALPSTAPSRAPSTVVPTSMSPTRAPTTQFPTGSGPPQPSSESDASPLDDTPTLIVIAICAGSIVLLACFTVCYVCCDSCCRGRRSRQPPRSTVNEVHNATFFIDANPPRGSSPGGGSEYLQTVGADDFEVGGGAMAMGMASSTDPEGMGLTGPEASEFFEWLAELRKHRKVFAMLHKEMKAQQQSMASAGERLRFAKPLQNFSRLLDLFAQKKGHATAPSDGMALLDWAQKTLDRFNDEQ
eukprot:m.103660 g.103660  ORF g.103660 m.103660 type:complete len:376 (+) comp10491_c0_seq2:371-1498(+)